MHQMVEICRKSRDKTNGNINWFVKEDFTRHKLEDYYYKDVKTIDFKELKNKVIDILLKEGFIFYDEIEYQYAAKFGKLLEFGVNYNDIK